MRPLHIVRDSSCLVLAFFLFTKPLAGQERVLRGTVLDGASGRPITGAHILVAGTQQGVTTDAGGRFLLRVSGNQAIAIQVQHLGYRTVTRSLQSSESATEIALTAVPLVLDEVVVTGTAGGAEKRALGNAVDKVSATGVLTLAPAGDAHQLLNGRVPGLSVLPIQGVVGTGSKMRVRGISSLSLSNEPLLYLDGIRVDNNTRAGPRLRGGSQISRLMDIPAEDIESIEIIKGPAAATLYGTEASRGVIQIITRQGYDGPPRLEASIKQGVNWFMNPEGRLKTVYAIDPATGALDSLDLYKQEADAGRPYFQNGHVKSYVLNLRGGNAGLRYYLSGEWDDETGVLWYNWRKRGGLRANLRIVPRSTIDIEANTGFIENRSRLEGQLGIMGQLHNGTPLKRNSATRGFSQATPEQVAQIESMDAIHRFISSVKVLHNPRPWLSQRLVIGLDVGDETASVLFPRQPDPDSSFLGKELGQGEKSVDRVTTTYRTLDYSARASVRPHSNLEVTSTIGAQYYRKLALTYRSHGLRFPVVGVDEIAAAADTDASDDRIENKTLGVFVQEQIAWMNRRFLTVALRADDNSAFGNDFSYVAYPKVSASWVLNEEAFWRVPGLDALKLRAAWGQAGQQPDAFAARRSYASVPGPGDQPGLTPSNLGNPKLRPERAQELEVGFDAGLLNDRLGITFTHYDQRTTDAIVAHPARPSLGFPGTEFVNLGATRNRGSELGLNARLIQTNRVALDIGLTYARNANEVVDLGGLPPVSVRVDVQQHRQGFPLAGYFGRVVVGARIVPDRRGRPQPVDVMCKRESAEPTLCVTPTDTAPPVYLGTPTPRWEGSAHATLTVLGSIRLYGLVDFKGGHVANTGDALAFGPNNSRAINVRTDPILLGYEWLGAEGLGNVASNTYRAGFAKLREVSATITLPQPMTRLLGSSRATLSLAGRNLATLWVAQKTVSGFRILDPEVRSGSEFNDLANFTISTIPQYAQFLTTLRLSF